MAALGTTIGFLCVAVWLTIRQANGPWGQRFLFGDFHGYLDGAQRFLSTGTPFTPEQLSGSWQAMPDSFIHPPSALPLFLPFLWLPALLWWAIPLGVLGYCIARLRPAPWAWPVMALLLCWPRSYTYVLAGNTDMWVAAAIAAGAVWGWPAVLAGIKPTVFPLALLFARDRRWWAAGMALGVLTLPWWYLWPQWLSVVATSPYGVGYSLWSLPFLAIPVVAWVSRRRPRTIEPLSSPQSVVSGRRPFAR